MPPATRPPGKPPETSASRLGRLFPGRFFVIGMVHLPPLPGSPHARLPVDEIVAFARREVSALERGGVDGVLLENFGDAPFERVPADPRTLVAFGIVARAVCQQAQVPVGINVLRNAPIFALAIAAVAGAAFVRVNIHMGVYHTDQGVIEGTAGETLRYRRQVGAGAAAVLTDARVKHATHVAPFETLAEEIRTLVDRGRSDGIVLTGRATGAPITPETLAVLEEVHVPVPVIAGSGVTLSNIARLRACVDGAIVGTALKRDGVVTNPVDEARVRALVERVH